MADESSPHAVIAYHGYCFDGMASAALLTRFLRDHEGRHKFLFRGLSHQPGGSFVPDDVLDGDLNAVVDFRYTRSDRLHWFFDHHVSGVTAEEEGHLRADASGQKFFDPTYGSCCQLIADVLEQRFDYEANDLRELVRQAHMIDSASFPDAEAAVRIESPALQLMSVIEVHGSDGFLAPRIQKLAQGVSLAEIGEEKAVQALFVPIAKQHEATIDAIRSQARCEDHVVEFELSSGTSERYNKFIPYWLFPDASYCVAVTKGMRRAKVSVGFNPWSPRPRQHNIARLCERYGGGGHPVVGAVSLPPDQLERARKIGAEIAAALRAPG